MEDSQQSQLSTFVIASAAATLGVAAALSYAIFSKKSQQDDKVPGSGTVSCETSLDGSELDKEIYPGGHLTICYGSQTGTAESFALDLQREAQDHGFKARIVDLEDVGENDELKEELLNENYRDENGRSRILFLMATYGEGEPTDNAQGFISTLQQKSGILGPAAKETPDESEFDFNFLEGLDFSVFGLGNTQYEYFNAMGKLVDECLVKLGAKRIAPMGLGDDDADLESDFEQWRENVVWPALEKFYINSSSEKSTMRKSKGDTLPPCPFVVEYLPGLKNKTLVPDKVSESEIHSSAKHYFSASSCPITLKRELRSGDDSGSTLHVEVDISKSPVTYQTADNLAILPINDPELVSQLAEALSYDLDDVFHIKPAKKDGKHTHIFPTPCTVRDCLSRYCDITSAPLRSELKLLGLCASDPLDRDALLRMASKEGKAEYREKILDHNVGTADIVTRLCKSLRDIPLDRFLQICPRLQPRQYTISSSSSVSPDSVHLTVSILSKKREDGTMFKGLCTNYLARTDESIRVFCRDSTFRLPKDPSIPIIMVGPGTGIAPMRALLYERSHMKNTLKKNVGDNILYFGCKNRKLDYIYKDELENFQKMGDLKTLRLAFSREQAKKVYVQNLIEQDAKNVWELIDGKGAYVYICGGIQMGHDVCAVLRKICISEGAASNEEDAKKYLSNMHHDGRLVQELWA